MDNFIYKMEKALPSEICIKLINSFKDPRFKKEIKAGPINPFSKLTGTFAYEGMILNPYQTPFYKILLDFKFNYTLFAFQLALFHPFWQVMELPQYLLTPKHQFLIVLCLYYQKLWRQHDPFSYLLVLILQQ